jgi:hypothetical protein
MLNVNPETICFLISKAAEFHAKEEVVIPEQPLEPTDDWALQVLADHADDPTFQEFKATIDDLEPDQQATVVALMWLGRGDYSEDEWKTALKDARSRRNRRTAEYLISTPMVADYLEEGLSLMGYSCDGL